MQSCGRAYKSLWKGQRCIEVLLWGLLAAGEVYGGQGGRVGGCKQFQEDRRVSRWAAADRPQRCTPPWGDTDSKRLWLR